MRLRITRQWWESEMLKQTIVWTALPHRSLGPLAAGTKLRLSAFIAPRLWSDDPTIKKLQLSDFPDFLDWPKTLAATTFKIAFDGGPTLPATRVSDIDPTARKARSELWKALFKNNTLVIPFAFEDLTGAEILSFNTRVIVDAIQKVYTRAGIEFSDNLPNRSVLAGDTTLGEVARPRNPPERYVPVPQESGPVFVGTPGPEDPGVVTKPDEPGKGCAGCMGCLAAPWALLRRLLKHLGFLAALPFTMGGIGGGTTLGNEGGNGNESSSPAPAPLGMSATYTEFERLQTYVKATGGKDKEPEPMPSEGDLTKTYDFHQMVSTLGDYPNLLRYFGLVVDLEVTLGAALPAAAGMVSVTPTLPVALAMATTSYTPRTHYELGDGVFLTQSRPGGELRNGLLRVDDPNRFSVVQIDVPGSGIKVQSAATTIVSQETNGTWAGNDEEEQGLPYLQTAGLSIVRPDLATDLKATFFRSWALNKKLAAIDLSPVTVPAGPEPPATDEIWAEDALRGYRVDVFDDKSTHWHSLCRRVGTYTFSDAGAPLVEEDEGFVQMGVTEPVKKTPGKRELRAHESLFTWNGWSLTAPRYGRVILPTPDEVTSLDKAPNDPITQFKLETEFIPKSKSLPRLRFGYRYKLRARAVDLAGNSAFDPDDAAFDVTQVEVTPEEPFRRFEPVAPPMVMLQSEPVEGESLERLVVRSRFDNAPAPITVETTVRHLVPPKTSQLMAEHHRKFDGTPAVDGSLTAWELAAREAGSLMERVDPTTGVRSKIPGTDEVKAPLPPGSDPLKTPPPHTYWLQRNEAFDLTYLPDPYARGVLLSNLPGAPFHKVTFEGKWPDPKPFRLRVRGIGEKDAPAAPVWVPFNPADPTKSGLLEVELPQGQTFKVRISSWFHASDLENMAVWGWTAMSGVPTLNALRDQAIAGRNWLHLPYRTLALVHAVQQPLLIPAIEAVSADKTKLGDTVAILKGKIRVDAKSTEKLDVDAEWDDPFDDPDQAAPGSASQKMLIAQLRVDPINDLVSLDGVRHKFTDTKHHHVRYLPTGSTRFREYFPQAITNDPKNLIRPVTGELRTELDAHVPNATRPDAPKPLYLLPLFEWMRSATPPTFRAIRRGAGLRVYMDRPWYSSGEGELLGVALRPATVAIGSPKADALKKFTSEWGMDPLWNSTKTEPLSTSDFLGGTVSPASLKLAELDAEVDVVGYEPEFDPQRKLWFCDILLDPKFTYFPMVRLALVRYQPHSLKGAHISNVALTDFVQVVPHRDVRYDTTDLNKVKISVEGPAPAPATSFMVRIEEKSDVGAGDELGWTPFAMNPLRVTNSDPKSTMWEGLISTGGRPSPLRIVVLEAEFHRVDGAGATDFLKIAGDVSIGTSDRPLDYRITFADTLEI